MIPNREPGAGRLVDRPQQTRSDARGLQRAAIDDDDLDSRDQLAGVLSVARVYRGETLVVKPNAGNLPVLEHRQRGGDIEPRRTDTLESLRCSTTHRKIGRLKRDQSRIQDRKVDVRP